MSADSGHLNAPATAWAWLTRQLASLNVVRGQPSMIREWRRFRRDEDGQGRIGSLTEWPSDFWLARTQKAYRSILMPIWNIPESLDQWSTLEVAHYAGPRMSKTITQSASFLDLLARTDPTHVLSESAPIPRFYDLLNSSTMQADVGMISSGQIRAWLTTAFGDMLSGVALTPVVDDELRELLIHEVRQRISDVSFIPKEDCVRDLMDYGCATLYNTRVTPDGGLQTTVARQGQGKEWQHHWHWLSTPQDARAMKATLHLAGQLLINETLFTGLALTMRSADEHSRKRALCVMRRWLLTTKVLAWVVEALEHNWTSVRPQDLACFAFSALSPVWPRRAVAVSHRSAEAKPVLTKLKMWRSPHAAIDASFVPAWETNTGMIWSLFAAVPLVVRVESPAYFESEWCRREHEMLQYLVECGDFFEHRAVVDIGVDQLEELDVSLFDHGPAPQSSSPMKPFTALEGESEGEFPPLSLVLLASIPLKIDPVLLRAAGALRLINALVQNPRLANEVAVRAAAGDDIHIEPPTNNPDGWAAYGDIFRALEALLRHEPPNPSTVKTQRPRRLRRSLSLWLPDDYFEDEVQRDLASAGQILDLKQGQYNLADVLVALEWRRTVFTWFLDEGFGDKVVIDVSGANAEEWTTLPDMSVARGLLALNVDSPIWIMQRAGQNADAGPGFREQPIFTRHVDEQFRWLKPVTLNASWLIYYLANSGLRIESDLQAAMIAAVVHSAGPEAIQVERQAQGVGLVVPEPRSFFEIPEDVLQDVYDLTARTPRPEL